MVLKRLKKVVEEIPEPISSKFVYVPFSLRLGSQYLKSKKDIIYFETLSPPEQKKYIFDKFKKIVTYSYFNSKFYSDFYKKNKFYIESLKTFEDIERVPIITKKTLQNYGIESRSISEKGRLLVNTGGTSGQPLNFYLDSKAFAREWGHMHTIWSKLGYQHTDLKLIFRGKNLGDMPYKYNPVHNEYIINSYIDLNDLINHLSRLLNQKKVSYIHGYPSSIYNFSEYIEKNSPKMITKIRENLKGVLLGSEYPAPIYRNKIEKVLGVPTLSWYGHSEMAVLAYEKEKKYCYNPMQTYGFTEAVINGQGSYRLIGTSYNNTASPFIRYDTGDLITPINKVDGILKEFQIESGRIGDFIIDNKGHSISLTAMIFGRHHDAFGYAKFIQVKQSRSGVATILITPMAEESNTSIDWRSKFDFSNIDMRIEFQILANPVLSPAGKVPLLIK
ncbi:hypothetical protein ACJROX_26925 [Pseudalkalibacillus sp. A8]|uniref:hypothetical protein n=1 Tax=Pseudalkalibacillus sp. A8 TaxID=3382641 RepID=UPI0038B444B0